MPDPPYRSAFSWRAVIQNETQCASSAAGRVASSEGRQANRAVWPAAEGGVFAGSGGALAEDGGQRCGGTLQPSREISVGDSREAFNEAIFDRQGVSKGLTRVMLARAGAGGAAAS